MVDTAAQSLLCDRSVCHWSVITVILLRSSAEIAAEGFDAAPHLSCIGSTRESIREILSQYKAAGIRRTVAHG